jgi:hypothetical protein
MQPILPHVILFSHTFSHLLFSHRVASSIKMNASERYLRDAAGKGLFCFFTDFILFLSGVVSKRAPNRRA